MYGQDNVLARSMTKRGDTVKVWSRIQVFTWTAPPKQNEKDKESPTIKSTRPGFVGWDIFPYFGPRFVYKSLTGHVQGILLWPVFIFRV